MTQGQNEGAAEAFAMPPEWAPHARTWMAWPCSESVLADDEEGAFRAWAQTANTIAGFEPVTMLVPPGQEAKARALLDRNVEIFECPIADSWLRDSGPTFVTDGQGKLCAVDWTFNGWGGRTFPAARADVLVARTIAREAGARRVASKLVNEGGGIHVDGAGTLLLTRSVQLNPNRNPNWSEAEVEAECHRLLGTRHAIWLERGLAADSGPAGTDGHVDTLACFAAPGVVLAHGQPDPAHPDYAVAQENIAILKAAKDARGEPLEVIVLDAPAVRQDDDGTAVTLTYVNFYICNGAVAMCRFSDPRDEAAAAVLARLFPGRTIAGIDALRIFRGGGGVHCITQQQPAV